MKRFISNKRSVLVAFAMAICSQAGACGYYEPSYNYYLINYYRIVEGYPNPGDNLPFNEAYRKERDALKLRSTRDVQGYLNRLTEYSDICETRMQRWDYPSKEQLAQQQQQLGYINTFAINYKGIELKKEYALLYMRTNMLMKRYDTNLSYWKQTASKLPDGCYKEKMRSIFANALLNTGEWKKAVEIYAQQNDQESLEWAMRRYCNYAGVKKIAEEDPNSACVKYLMQKYVNSLQESLDDDFNDEAVKECNMVLVNKDDAKQFITLANNTAQKKKVKDPCMWKTAAAAVEFLLGDYSNAENDIEKAMKMNGVPMSKDNARAVRAIIKTKVGNYSDDFVVNELAWLDQKTEEFVKEHENDYSYSFYECYYERMKKRMIYCNLLPSYNEKAKTEPEKYNVTKLALNCNAKSECFETQSGRQFYRIFEENSSQDLIRFYNMLTKREGLDYALVKDLNINLTTISDIISTRLIAEGKFEDALTWLDKVPLSYLTGQRINWYMANRDMNVHRWEKRQQLPRNDVWDMADVVEEGTPLSENPKKVFCQKMIDLQKQLNVGNSDLQQQTAFTMGSLYLQASCYGDCWFLTRYWHDAGDSARVNDKDYAKAAMEMFDIAANNGSDVTIAAKALCGKAYTTYRVRDNSYWSWDEPSPYYWVKDDNLSKPAYTELYQYVEKHPETEYMVTKCDIGKAFKYSILR